MAQLASKTKCGLGLRREHLKQILASGFKPDFWEVTPENWIYTPFSLRADFEKIVSQTMVVAHSVTLSIGSNLKPSKKFLSQIRDFLDRFNIQFYGDHISFSDLDAHNTHELLPLPLTKAMLDLLCERVDYVQNALKRELILENATYYYAPQSQMSELDFITQLCRRSGAKLLLDVNNVYVNSKNHGFDAFEFINAIEMDSVAYLHIAGHLRGQNMLIDTHGEAVCDEVWELLGHTLGRKKVPCMIERDNKIPPLSQLIDEYEKMKQIWINA